MRCTDICLSLSTRLVRGTLCMSAALLLNFAAAGGALAGPIFTAELDGAQEVPPSGSTATGVATFAFNDALTELSYELSVFGLPDITITHIHLAPAGVNGPVVLVNLLAQGIVTEADLVGPLLGQSLTDLLADMTAGNTYVNVHTEQFPGGEIRGQIQRVSEPATLPVVAAGLLILVSLRRRRSSCVPS